MISSQPLFAPNPPSSVLCGFAPAAPSLPLTCHASLFLHAQILVALPGTAEMPPLPQFLPGPRGENNSFSEMLVALPAALSSSGYVLTLLWEHDPQHSLHRAPNRASTCCLSDGRWPAGGSRVAPGAPSASQSTIPTGYVAWLFRAASSSKHNAAPGCEPARVPAVYLVKPLSAPKLHFHLCQRSLPHH